MLFDGGNVKGFATTRDSIVPNGDTNSTAGANSIATSAEEEGKTETDESAAERVRVGVQQVVKWISLLATGLGVNMVLVGMMRTLVGEKSFFLSLARNYELQKVWAFGLARGQKADTAGHDSTGTGQELGNPQPQQQAMMLMQQNQNQNQDQSPQHLISSGQVTLWPLLGAIFKRKQKHLGETNNSPDTVVPAVEAFRSYIRAKRAVKWWRSWGAYDGYHPQNVLKQDVKLAVITFFMSGCPGSIP